MPFSLRTCHTCPPDNHLMRKMTSLFWSVPLESQASSRSLLNMAGFSQINVFSMKDDPDPRDQMP